MLFSITAIGVPIGSFTVLAPLVTVCVPIADTIACDLQR